MQPTPRQHANPAVSALPWGAESSNLDFLRASAVLMVLAFHVLAFFGTRRAGPFDLEVMGLFGVLLFFVHTSFVLMLSLERQTAKWGQRKLFVIFIARRFFRIYPLSTFVVAVIVLFRLPLAGHPWAMNWPYVSGWDILSNFFLIQNVTWSNSLQGPLWSLPFEVQMYLFLPALFLLARRVKSFWILPAGWLLVAGAMSIWVYMGHGRLLRYVPCFLSGVIAYKLSKQTQPRWCFWGWPLLLWSVPAFASMLRAPETDWLTCFVIGLALPRFVEPKPAFLRRASYLIAKYSYGLYLSHYFCQWLAFTKLNFLPAEFRWLIFVVLVMALPVVLYHGVEQPFIGLGKRFVENWLTRAPARMLASKAA